MYTQQLEARTTTGAPAEAAELGKMSEVTKGMYHVTLAQPS